MRAIRGVTGFVKSVNGGMRMKPSDTKDKPVHPDCFGYSGGKCIVLNKTDCLACPFYKPKWRLELEQQKAKERLAQFI